MVFEVWGKISVGYFIKSLSVLTIKMESDHTGLTLNKYHRYVNFRLERLLLPKLLLQVSFYPSCYIHMNNFIKQASAIAAVCLSAKGVIWGQFGLPFTWFSDESWISLFLIGTSTHSADSYNVRSTKRGFIVVQRVDVVLVCQHSIMQINATTQNADSEILSKMYYSHLSFFWYDNNTILKKLTLVTDVILKYGL